MNHSRLWLAFFLACSSLLGAQQQSIDLFIAADTDGLRHLDTWPLDAATPFYAVAFSWPQEVTASLWVRFGKSRKELGPWQPVHPDPHAAHADKVVSALLWAPASTRWFELRSDEWPEAMSLHMHVYSPGHSTRLPLATSEGSTRDCPCPLPALQDRAAWCPDGSCPPDPSPTPTTVSHMIVHHSATAGTASDWAAVVRSIWDFHVHVNGWDDIGYNYLIAPDGTLFEGRGDNVLGAHFCGTNTGTMGVCMMGTWNDTPPPDTAQATLQALLAWKSCSENLDPLASAFHPASGFNLYRISGHRDGCATQCPGQALYDQLPQLRVQVADLIASGCTQVVLPAPHLQATALSPTTIHLSWTDPGNETGFQIERSESFNNNYTQAAALGPDTLEWTDQGLTPNTGYFYRIRAMLDAEVSPWSNEVFLFTPISTATRDIPGLIQLQLLPNPTTGRLALSWHTSAPLHFEAVLCSADGRIWWRHPMQLEGKGSAAIPAHLLPKGMAWLYLLHERKHVALSFIKM